MMNKKMLILLYSLDSKVYFMFYFSSFCFNEKESNDSIFSEKGTDAFQID